MDQKKDASSSPNETKQSLRYMQIAAIGALVLIAAVIYTFAHIPSPAPASSLPPVTATASTDRQKPPQFEWSGNGAHLSSQSLEGVWTLLSFWSYTCAPCLEELPDLDQFAEDWSGPELSVVTVNEDANTGEMGEAVKQFLEENEVQVPVYYDTEGKLKSVFNVQNFPTHFLINPNGEVVWHASGAFNWTAPESQKSLLTVIR
jgi:thiol-disulfide isomerase/thioredoxin